MFLVYDSLIKSRTVTSCPPPTDHVKECEEEMKAKKDQSDGGKL